MMHYYPLVHVGEAFHVPGHRAYTDIQTHDLSGRFNLQNFVFCDKNAQRHDDINFEKLNFLCFNNNAMP